MIPPKTSIDFFNLAMEKQKSNEMAEAYKLFLACVRADPPHAGGWNNLGVMLQNNQRPAAARAAFKRAVEIDPTNAFFLANLGDICWNLLDYETAEWALTKATLLDETNAVAHYDLALVYMNTSRLDKALDLANKACALSPDRVDFAWGRGFIQLFQGDFVHGWKSYDYRLPFKLPDVLKLPYPMWNGEPLKGKTIFLYHEQGFGDSIMFLRFLKYMPEGSKIILSMPAELHRLVRRNFKKYYTKLISSNDAMPPADFHLPLTGIAGRLGFFDPKGFAHDGPYIKPPTDGPTLPVSSRALKVGLCWAGNSEHERDAQRSITLEQALKYFVLPNVELYSLQVGVHANDVNERGAQSLVYDVSPLIRDFADTASIISQLEVVITVDTAVAHLAGAMGKPTCLLLPIHGCDWRWGPTENTNPWYPSITSYRQEIMDDWTSPLKGVTKYLLGHGAIDLAPGEVII
jgi:tetratricopeptide (TPR) repeat protein